MILTRHEISKLIREKQLEFLPSLDEFQNQPHAVDLRLGTTFYLPKTWQMTKNGRELLTVDVINKQEENYEKIQLLPGQYFELGPNESIIASTRENICIREKNIMGVLYPRSSVNRRGLSVDMTGIIDAHYSGNLMIPILNKTNSQIIRLYPYERICQIVFHKLDTPLEKSEANKHGVSQAKYTDNDSFSHCSKPDSQTEIDAIYKGNLDSLPKYKTA